MQGCQIQQYALLLVYSSIMVCADFYTPLHKSNNQLNKIDHQNYIINVTTFDRSLEKRGFTKSMAPNLMTPAMVARIHGLLGGYEFCYKDDL